MISGGPGRSDRFVYEGLDKGPLNCSAMPAGNRAPGFDAGNACHDECGYAVCPPPAQQLVRDQRGNSQEAGRGTDSAESAIAAERPAGNPVPEAALGDSQGCQHQQGQAGRCERHRRGAGVAFSGQRDGRLGGENNRGDRQGEADDNCGLPFPAVTERWLAQLSLEPPDQGGRADDVSKDAEANREYTQAVTTNAGRDRYGTGYEAEGYGQPDEPESSLDEFGSVNGSWRVSSPRHVRRN